jgi:hypothetical protein
MIAVLCVAQPTLAQQQSDQVLAEVSVRAAAPRGRASPDPRRDFRMKMLAQCTLLAALAAAPAAQATGLATCDSGDMKDWQPSKVLVKQLEAKGWKVRNVKIDGGCYEVYALDENGRRVEAYFHPRTLAPVPTQRR